MNIQELAALAASTEDQTETTAGGDFEFTPPVAGLTVGRMIEYIELGIHPQKPYQGKAKPDAEKVRITFELLSPTKNIKKVEIDGKETEITETISATLTKKFGEKAGFKKLFNKMQRGRSDIKHMAQMLNEPFLITIFHNEVEKDGKKTVYANISNADGEYGISAPVREDPIAGTQTVIPVPEARRPLKLFLWDHANKDMWDSLFVDGTYETKNAKGEVTQVSKNRTQEFILSAKNYKGSALETLLAGIGTLPTSELSAEEELTPEAKGPVVSNDADDALAMLGLG